MTQRWDETLAFLAHVERLGGGPDAIMRSSSAAAGWMEAERLRARLADRLRSAEHRIAEVASQAAEATARWNAEVKDRRAAEARAEQAERDLGALRDSVADVIKDADRSAFAKGRAAANEAAAALGRKHARQWAAQSQAERATAITCLVSEIEASARRTA